MRSSIHLRSLIIGGHAVVYVLDTTTGQVWSRDRGHRAFYDPKLLETADPNVPVLSL